MKLWIIYKDGIGLARVVAEMLQDRLETFLDVSVGEANKIEPAFLIEEKPDILIIGDIVIENYPSTEMKNWLNNFKKCSEKMQFTLKNLSGFFITNDKGMRTEDWGENIKKILSTVIISPPFEHFSLNTVNLTLEKAFEKVKKYSDRVVNIVLDEEWQN